MNNFRRTFCKLVRTDNHYFDPRFVIEQTKQTKVYSIYKNSEVFVNLGKCVQSELWFDKIKNKFWFNDISVNFTNDKNMKPHGIIFQDTNYKLYTEVDKFIKDTNNLFKM